MVKLTEDQVRELKEANKQILVSGLSAVFIIARMAQQNLIELTDEVVDYLNEKDKNNK